mgnify:CR=1 FL=1
MLISNTPPPPPAADHFLSERGLQTACYHGDVPVEERRAAMTEFAAADGERPPLLVCTDLAARWVPRVAGRGRGGRGNRGRGNRQPR